MKVAEKAPGICGSVLVGWHCQTRVPTDAANGQAGRGLTCVLTPQAPT